jgi:hypothetical protein
LFKLVIGKDIRGSFVGTNVAIDKPVYASLFSTGAGNPNGVGVSLSQKTSKLSPLSLL